MFATGIAGIDSTAERDVPPAMIVTTPSLQHPFPLAMVLVWAAADSAQHPLGPLLSSSAPPSPK